MKLLKFDTAGARNVKKMVAAANKQQEDSAAAAAAEKAADFVPTLSRKPLTFADVFVKQRTEFFGAESEKLSKSDSKSNALTIPKSALNAVGVTKSGSNAMNIAKSGSITMNLAEIKAAKAKKRAAETLRKKGVAIEKADPNEIPGKRRNGLEPNGQNSPTDEPEPSASGKLKFFNR